MLKGLIVSGIFAIGWAIYHAIQRKEQRMREEAAKKERKAWVCDYCFASNDSDKTVCQKCGKERKKKEPQNS